MATRSGSRQAVRLAAVLTLLAAGGPALAQDAADDPGATALDTLLAPVALFPDPLLAAVLQASVVPLDVVMAARFLDEYAKDQTATPDPKWDPAVRGLLAFPTVLRGMNEHLDWVQSVGDAVVNRLPAVQDAIQQDRAEFQAGGVLRSDERQRVEDDGDVIRVTPMDPAQIFVPVYDPEALVAAIRATHSAEASETAATESGPPPEASAAPVTPEAPVAASPPPAPAPSQEAAAPATLPAVTEAAPATPPPAAAAPQPPAEAASPAPAPPAAVYAAPAGYAAPMTYAAPVAYPAAPSPTSSVLPVIGSFAGGALVGGLLGYAIGDDDDHDHHDDGWHSDLDEDDLDDVVDRIDDDRDHARSDRQDYATGSREDRQDFANQAREDRQAQQSTLAGWGQDDRLRRERSRQNQAANTQAQLASRAQGRASRPAAAVTRRATPSPVAIQAAVAPTARRPAPQFRQDGAAGAGNAGSLPRTANAAATRATPVRVGDQGGALPQAALSGTQRGATARQQELRGAQSRQPLAQTASRQPAIARPAPSQARPEPIRARQAGGGGDRPALTGPGDHRPQPFAGAGGGGQVQAFAERGRLSRHR